MKKLLLRLPEYYLILLALAAGYSPPYGFNPLFMGVIAIVVLQLVFRNRITGLVLGMLFFLANVYFIGAVLSEFSEFTVFNTQAKQLIFVGSGIGLLNFILSTMMIYTYAKHPTKSELRPDSAL